MTWLDELDAAAAQAIETGETGASNSPRVDYESFQRHEKAATAFEDGCTPERIRALIACIRIADKMRLATVPGDLSEDMAATDRAYDAARAALEAAP